MVNRVVSNRSSTSPVSSPFASLYKRYIVFFTGAIASLIHKARGFVIVGVLYCLIISKKLFNESGYFFILVSLNDV